MKSRLTLGLLVLLAACGAPSGPAAPASADDEAVAAAVVPVLNATFPYRVEANDDPKDPLGVRRVPTDRVVLKSRTGPALKDAAAVLKERAPGREALVSAWEAANASPVQWSALLGASGVAAGDAETSGGWKRLAQTEPTASAVVVLSRPGYADGQALVSAAVETSRPPKLEIYFLLARDGSNWVVTNSVSRER